MLAYPLTQARAGAADETCHGSGIPSAGTVRVCTSPGCRVPTAALGVVGETADLDGGGLIGLESERLARRQLERRRGARTGPRSTQPRRGGSPADGGQGQPQRTDEGWSVSSLSGSASPRTSSGEYPIDP